ncbi:MAG: hypothetical protein ACREPR_01105, partial [Brasilonema sp.]
MSIYDNNIQAFIKVIESQPHVISTQDWAELHQLSGNLSEDKEEIAERIENWLQPESRRQILQAYGKQLELLISSYPIDLDVNLGMGGSKSPTPLNQPKRYGEARAIYSYLEKNIQEFSNLIAKTQTPTSDLKKLLAKIPQNNLDYTRCLQDLQTHQT